MIKNKSSILIDRNAAVSANTSQWVRSIGLVFMAVVFQFHLLLIELLLISFVL